MNACAKFGCPLREYTQYADSITICLSKGLGAPVGSILAGNADFIVKDPTDYSPNFFSKLTKLKTKFGISCSKEWVNTILKSIYHPVFVLVFLENLTFGLRFG